MISLWQYIVNNSPIPLAFTRSVKNDEIAYDNRKSVDKGSDKNTHDRTTLKWGGKNTLKELNMGKLNRKQTNLLMQLAVPFSID